MGRKGTRQPNKRGGGHEGGSKGCLDAVSSGEKKKHAGQFCGGFSAGVEDSLRNRKGRERTLKGRLDHPANSKRKGKLPPSRGRDEVETPVGPHYKHRAIDALTGQKLKCFPDRACQGSPGTFLSGKGGHKEYPGKTSLLQTCVEILQRGEKKWHSKNSNSQISEKGGEVIAFTVQKKQGRGTFLRTSYSLLWKKDRYEEGVYRENSEEGRRGINYGFLSCNVIG